ncbi:MAG: O-methyltransferase [Parvularculaceae bacterium]
MSRSIGLSERVEAYVRAMNRDERPALVRCREETYAECAIPTMQISPEQAEFMAFLARMIGAQIYVEVGVFTGYSALAMALALKDMHGDAARVIACDISEEFIGRARGYWSQAGVDSVIDVRIGPANETLAALPDASADMMFIDADKTGYSDYYEEGARILRSGGVMVFDNVLWDGAVAEPGKTSDDIEALRAVAQKAKADLRFDVAFTAIGDGLLLCRKREKRD